jgi:glycosyltransferase involved in cell wall biosynthesis
MQPPCPALSLIIAVYEHPDFLEKIFLALQNQRFDDFEVIVADDGSGDEIPEVIARYQQRLRHPIQHVWHEDKGFRKTIIINKAVVTAQADYLVFIDGDSIPHHRFLEFHYKRRKRQRVLTGRRVKLSKTLSDRITNEDVRTRRLESWSFCRHHCLKPGFKHGLFLPGMFFLRNTIRRNYKIVGANFSVHTQDFMAINGYDERIIGRGLEDNNLYARFRAAGMRVCSVVFEALQYHLYHDAAPIPHDSSTIELFKSTTQAAYTPYGISQHRDTPCT